MATDAERSADVDEQLDYRFTLANERTFLSWQRTALGLLAAAVALVQLVPELGVPGARRLMGVGLALLAIMTSGVGLVRWRQTERAMRSGEPMPKHPSPAYLALGLVILKVGAPLPDLSRALFDRVARLPAVRIWRTGYQR